MKRVTSRIAHGDLVAAFRHPTDSGPEIGLWAAHHPEPFFDTHAGSRTELLAAAAWRVATFFD